MTNTHPVNERGEPTTFKWVFNAEELDRLTRPHDGGNKVKQAEFLRTERSMLHKIKTDRATPSSSTVLRIAAILSVPVEQLFRRCD